MNQHLPDLETVNGAASWQARLFNRLLAFGFKRRTQGRIDVEDVRRVAASVDRLAVMPKRVEIRGELIDGLTWHWYRVPEAADHRVILYLHGGGYVIKTPRSHGAMLARLCAKTGMSGVMVDYPLVPEHPVSSAYDQCLTAYRRLLDSGINAADIIIAGDSAGGNLSLSTLMRIRDLEWPMPAGAILLSPCTDLTLSGDSVLANMDLDPMLSASFLAVIRRAANADSSIVTDPIYSPYHGELGGLPPVLVVVGTEELLLDDSRAVAAKLKASGNAGDLRIWRGLPHVFPLLHRVPEADRCLGECAEFIRQCLSPVAPISDARQTTAE